MLNVFSINEIPGTDQSMLVYFNDLGRAIKVERFDTTGLIETIEYHVNGQVASINGVNTLPMTSLVCNSPFRIAGFC